jgi:hypothetical protein
LSYMVVAEQGRTVLTGSSSGVVESWSAHSADQSAELLTLFLNVHSGLEINQETTADSLESAAWWERLDRLRNLAEQEDPTSSLQVPTVFEDKATPVP